MAYIIQKIHQHRHFLLFILLFAYIQSIYTRMAVRQQITVYTFTPEAALATLLGAVVLFLIIFFLIKKWQKTRVLNTKVLLQIFGYSLLIFVVSMQLIGWLVALAFDKVAQNFNQHVLIFSLFSDFLDGIIYGSFFLAYYYYQNDKKHRRKLAVYNEILAESRINQLKTQLNPHFLFNNLNILDQLIEEDKYEASKFLHEFAEIYRYVLYSMDKELVGIEEEVDFARQYFKLIQHKYESAYQLNIEIRNSDGFIVPLTLQLLIENIVKHNLGTVDKPVFIHIIVDQNIIVSNNTNLKRSVMLTSGRALKNLKEQYGLLIEKPIIVHHVGGQFRVSLPLITKRIK